MDIMLPIAQSLKRRKERAKAMVRENRKPPPAMGKVKEKERGKANPATMERERPREPLPKDPERESLAKKEKDPEEKDSKVNPPKSVSSTRRSGTAALPASMATRAGETIRRR
jgi:hypothetical protein